MTNAKPQRRWFHLTSNRLVIGLLAVEGFLLLSERFDWFPSNEKKGWTVLIAVASVVLVMLLLVVWFVASLILRWRFQFGVRSLFVLALAVAISCSWLVIQWQQAKEQKAAVEGIEESGGWARVEYDYQRDEAGNWIQNAEPPGPEWLRKVLGDEFFTNVVGVSLSGNETDPGLNWLEDLPKLERLHLSGATDAALGHVNRLSQLKEMDLRSTEVTDAGLAHLEGLSQLRSLNLVHTEITDVGLARLKGLVQLQDLNLGATHLTDAGLKYLGGMTQLQVLYLDRNGITDAGLGCLKRLRQLRHLDLNWTMITDAGLEHLSGLSQLQVLDLTATQVTDTGIKKLQQALPNCKIIR